MMPGRMMSQRGGPRGRMPPHAGRGGYYGGTLISSTHCRWYGLQFQSLFFDSGITVPSFLQFIRFESI